MKKIIKGKSYDTETAKNLGCYQYSNPMDFNYLREELFQKRTGEYFLYGEGGSMTTYSVSCGGNTRCGGYSILPLSEDKAKRWAENHLSAQEYEEIFGKVFDDTSAAKRIKEMRTNCGLTQTAFSKKTGVPLRTLQSWELGERVPAAYIVDMIEKIMNLDFKKNK